MKERRDAVIVALPKAFSSEVDTGSRGKRVKTTI
jgi:hypothetical protein